MKTYAPSFTNSLAVARPMPLLPPVMSAIFPSSLPMEFSLRMISPIKPQIFEEGLRSWNPDPERQRERRNFRKEPTNWPCCRTTNARRQAAHPRESSPEHKIQHRKHVLPFLS